MTKLHWAAAVTALLSFSSPARAQVGTAPAASGTASPSEDVRLTYGAPAGCPSREEFVDQVNAHGVTLVPSDAPTSRAMTITIDGEPSWHGHFAIATAKGESTRETTGASCEDVVRSLAIFTSLAIGPSASVSGDAATPPQPPRKDPEARSTFVAGDERPPPPPPGDLLKARFALTIEQGTFESSHSAAAYGGGARLTYHASKTIGFDLEGEGYRSFAHQTWEPTGRVVLGLEIDFLRARKPLVDLWHGTFDVYFLAQGGLAVTRPTPAGDTYSWKAGPDATASLGFRYYVNDSFALTVETGLDFMTREVAYEELPVPTNLPGPVLIPEQRQLETGVWTSLGLTFFFGKPTPPKPPEGSPAE